MPNSIPPNSNLSAMIKRHMGCLTMVGILAVTISMTFAMNHFAQFLYISCAYGSAAWESGLRVINKQGELSNGKSLSGWGHFFVFIGGYLLTIPFFVGSAYGFAYLTMKIQGETLREQLAMWKSENEKASK